MDVGETPIDFGSLKAGQVQRALTYLRNGGATRPRRNDPRRWGHQARGNDCQFLRLPGSKTRVSSPTTERAGVQVVGDLSVGD